MFDTEEQKPKSPGYVLGSVLDDYSVDQLSDLVERLRAEIARVETERDAKQSSRTAADAFFKK